jgi:TolB-like protein
MRNALPAIFLLLSGCTGMSATPGNYMAADSPFIKANYMAAESLSKPAAAFLDKSAPIVVATLVNIDHLEQSSTLGRTVSEQVSSKLANLGFTVKEVKLRGTLFVKSNTGELLLSRELKDISASQKAQAVVVGTYSYAGEYVYLNLKLVGVNNTILSGYDYAIPVNSTVKNMLGVR